MRKFFWITGFISLIAILSWKAFLYNHHLRFVPDHMGVWWVRYVSEEAWGFGPGANEVGIIVYDMPKKVSVELENKGIDWLETLPDNNPRGRQRKYKTWQSTPVPSSEGWADPSKCSSGYSVYSEYSESYKSKLLNACPSVIGYMGKYGYIVPTERLPTDVGRFTL